MKNFFKGYYRLTDGEFKTLWKNAVFVFDTNVLLNLYRYQSSTRDSLFNVMERLSDRVWIPYHVGLEFQRNRLKVIAEQHTRYSEVKTIITKSLDKIQKDLDGLQLKKRHSHINPDKLLKDIQNAKQRFFEELEPLEEKSISVTSEDEIRDRIDRLFDNRIGPIPEDQNEIDTLQQEGENRYKNSIPPGFNDSSKGVSQSDNFTYSGRKYKRKFGDLIVWKQIIKYTNDTDLKDLIFVTDDNKSDWWWKIDSQGSKTIGVRPELTDEISRESNVERFYVYNTESFLNYANEQLGTQVTKEAIDEVRELMISKAIKPLIKKRFAEVKNGFEHTLSGSAEKAVYKWLSEKFHHIERNDGFPDFISFQDELKIGYEVKSIQGAHMIPKHLNEIAYHSYYFLNEENFYKVVLIFVLLNEEITNKAIQLIKEKLPKIKGNFEVIIGEADMDHDGSIYRFIPYESFN